MPGFVGYKGKVNVFLLFLFLMSLPCIRNQHLGPVARRMELQLRKSIASDSQLMNWILLTGTCHFYFYFRFYFYFVLFTLMETP